MARAPPELRGASTDSRHQWRVPLSSALPASPPWTRRSPARTSPCGAGSPVL